MGHVSGATLNLPRGRVQVNPEEEAKERSLEVVIDVRVVQHSQQLRDLEDRLADRLDEPILTLQLK